MSKLLNYKFLVVPLIIAFLGSACSATEVDDFAFDYSVEAEEEEDTIDEVEAGEEEETDEESNDSTEVDIVEAYSGEVPDGIDFSLDCSSDSDGSECSFDGTVDEPGSIPATFVLDLLSQLLAEIPEGLTDLSLDCTNGTESEVCSVDGSADGDEGTSTVNEFLEQLISGPLNTALAAIPLDWTDFSIGCESADGGSPTCGLDYSADEAEAAEIALDNAATVCAAVVDEATMAACDEALDAAWDACDALPDEEADDCGDTIDAIEEAADDALDALEDEVSADALDNAATDCAAVVDEATMAACDEALDAAGDACDALKGEEADDCSDAIDAIDEAAD